MKRAAALQTLTEHKAQIVRRFGVAFLALFGSTARDEATQDCDVDLLVSFVGPAISAQFFGMQFYLDQL
jgi:hypothetical protein